MRVEVSWSANGRVLPSQAEREQVAAAVKLAAEELVESGTTIEDDEDLESRAIALAERQWERFGVGEMTQRDYNRIIADMDVRVVAD